MVVVNGATMTATALLGELREAARQLNEAMGVVNEARAEVASRQRQASSVVRAADDSARLAQAEAAAASVGKTAKGWEKKQRVCRCGCGAVFTPEKPRQAYASSTCPRKTTPSKQARHEESLKPRARTGVCKACSQPFTFEAKRGRNPAYCPEHRAASRPPRKGPPPDRGKCRDCGVVIEGAGPKTRFCAPCAAKRKRERMRAYMKVYYATKLKKLRKKGEQA
jgi:hypothetical protein